jgi:hypothetical protein
VETGRRLTSSKVLKSILIIDSVRRVVLGELEDLGVVLSKVSDNGVGDLRNVEESVTVISGLSFHGLRSPYSHQVNRPVGGNRRLSQGPAVHAELSVVESVGVGEIANDSLGRGVVTSPMSSPSRLATVLG